MRPSNGIPSEPNDDERAEYAMCLVKAGAPEASLGILETINENKLTQVALYRGGAYLAQWNYAEAAVAFENYLKFNLDPYDALVGKTNLASCLVYERRIEEAETLLYELRQEALTTPYALLNERILYLSAQQSINQERWDEAQLFLKQARDMLVEKKGLDAYLIRKWEAILNFKKSNCSRAALNTLNQVRMEAHQYNQWESIRYIDRITACHFHDRELLTHLYYGTPFPAFRQSLVTEFGGDSPMADSYLWFPGAKAAAHGTLDLFLASAQEGQLKRGQLMHRLLTTLCSDFYRPFRLITLYSKLFPKQHYNPMNSPARVHLTISRLRDWFKQNNVSLKIDQQSQFYQLTASIPYAVRISHQEILTTDSKIINLSVVHEQYPHEEITTRTVCELLKISADSALRILKEGEQTGKLTRMGRGRATMYRFNDKFLGADKKA